MEVSPSRTSGIKQVVAPASFRVLTLGSDGSPQLPRLSGLVETCDANTGFDGVVLTGEVSAAELWAALHEGRALFAPIADFWGNPGLRSDFSAPGLTARALRDGLQVFSPIVRRMPDLPDITDSADRDGLYALGLAYSRDIPLNAAWSATTSDTVRYPLLGPVAGARNVLESLSGFGLLHRRFFGRTNLCGHCASARLNVAEACVSCASTHLAVQKLVHHFACGYQGPESSFGEGPRLICPKCREELRHFGVDYDKPGEVVLCQACGAAMPEPGVSFTCLDCHGRTGGDDAGSLDWFNYDLTPDGVAALRAGRLPHLDLAELLAPFPRAMSRRDFLLVAGEELRVAARYGRPFSIGRLQVSNAKALRLEHVLFELEQAFRLMVDMVVEDLRDADFVTVSRSEDIFIALPETGSASATPALERIREKVRAAIGLPIELSFAIAEGDQAERLLKDEL